MMEEMKSNLNRVADAVKYLTGELNKNPGDLGDLWGGRTDQQDVKEED